MTLIRRRQQSSLFAMRNIPWQAFAVKFTSYFLAMRSRADRAIIREEWILQAVEHPIREVIQKDGRIRRWVQIDEMDGKYLRVILLPDRETVHNAFFDRTFEP